MRPEDLTPTVRRVLLRVAREAIAARLTGSTLPKPEAGGILQEACGAFVTLRTRADGALRGCIGYTEAVYPLIDVVAKVAIAAATEDNRFDPVTIKELPSLALDISVLSPLRPVAPDEVEVGRDGLVIRHSGRSGLLLPQVATEQDWDRETFLDHTCLKAGLPRDTWRKPGVRLYAFSATVFGEDDE